MKKIVPVLLLVLIFTVCVLGILKFGKTSNLDSSSNNGDSNEVVTPSLRPDEDTNQEKEEAGDSEGAEDKEETEGTEGEKDVSGEIDSESSIQTKANDLMQAMTLREKVGQMFFVRCDSSSAVADIKKYHLGGLVLFANNFEDETKDSIKEKIASYQEASEIPLLIGVDEEGGTVTRVSKFAEFRKTPFLSPRKLYNEGGLSRIIEDTKEKAELLKSLGINVNLAPVCDVSEDPADYIYDRTLGLNAEKTAEYIDLVVRTMNDYKLGSTLKHFPGYGNNENTHTGISLDNRSYETLVTKDFLPFQAGITAGAGSVLVSHNIVSSMDDKLPASLSKEVHRILRDELEFDGVIMTDDLSMDAITTFTDGEAAAVTAVLAGNDLLIATDYKKQIPAVIAAVVDGKISEETINEAVVRVLTWKLSLGLMEE